MINRYPCLQVFWLVRIKFVKTIEISCMYKCEMSYSLSSFWILFNCKIPAYRSMSDYIDLLIWDNLSLLDQNTLYILVEKNELRKTTIIVHSSPMNTDHKRISNKERENGDLFIVQSNAIIHHRADSKNRKLHT